MDAHSLPDRSAEKARYDEHQNNVIDDGYRGFLDRSLKPLIARLSGPPEALLGLDFGSGPFPALQTIMKERGFRMDIYDKFYAPDEAVLARRAHYDFITCTETAEHFHEPRREFERLRGLLKDDGLLVVQTTFLTDDGMDTKRFENWYYRRDPTHCVFYRRGTLEWVAKELLRMKVLEFCGGSVALFGKGDASPPPPPLNEAEEPRLEAKD
jgi:hypothetical protein